MTALKDLFNRMDSDNFEARSSSMKLEADLRSNYLMNSTIQGVEDADLLLIVGSNPRFEAPVLNSRILKSTKNLGLKVALVG
jgi:NADH dehydrogenase (ubiquinone) Fe-S protein 1